MKKCGLRKAYEGGGLLDAFNKRQGEWEAAMQPAKPTATGYLQDRWAVEDAQRERLGNSLRNQMDSLTGVGSSNLSQRQKARAMADLSGQAGKAGIDLAGAPTMSGLSARQQLGLNMANASAANAGDEFNTGRQVQLLQADYADRQRNSLGFQNGGVPRKETTDELLARMRATYGGAPAAEPAPAPAPVQATPQPVAAKPQGFIGGIRAALDPERRMKAAGFENGGRPGVDDRGFIHGPKGVDKVPAKVADTGEDILVTAGERIVNKEQNAELEKLAAEKGMGLDEYLETATGKPVGPKLKGGLRAAQRGLPPEENLVQRGITTMRGQLAQPQAAPPASKVYSDLGGKGVVEAVSQHAFPNTTSTWKQNAKDINDAYAKGGFGSALGQSVRGAGNLAGAVQDDVMRSAAYMLDPAANALKTAVTGDATPINPQPTTSAQATKSAVTPAASDPSYDRKEFRGAQGNIAARQELDNADIKGLRQAGATGAVMGDVTEKGKTPGQGIRTIDTANGKVYAGRDKSGQLHVNFNSGVDAAEADKQRDERFAKAGYGKDAYGNWVTPQRLADKQALETMERSRARFDAFDPSITDPNARAAGMRRVMYDMANDERAAKQASERAKGQMELAKFNQEERKIANLQGNSDREFGQKQSEAHYKRLDDILKAKATNADGKMDGQKYAMLQQYAGNFKSDAKVGSEAYFKDLMANLELDEKFMADDGSLFRSVRSQGTDPARGLSQQNGTLWGSYYVDPATNRRVSASELSKMSPSAREALLARMQAQQ